ncbi:acyl carrier protein [Brevibacillus fulvus]|uniref:Acyl carrier protein n=1 Tax=Brevibacillus fulvus TaxID=1125967 RepID=A0A938Y1X3_9BACL|nr:phosphopantetheine-binding protein [Brevibacillus fulvus]MBM7589660.1 acyl carrier protein [Brevibacillus fulvus]
MIQTEQILEIVKKISGRPTAEMSSSFAELGMSSTNIVEMLIEFEMIFDVDVLDENLNIFELQTVQEAHDYINRLVEKKANG